MTHYEMLRERIEVGIYDAVVAKVNKKCAVEGFDNYEFYFHKYSQEVGKYFNRTIEGLLEHE